MEALLHVQTSFQALRLSEEVRMGVGGANVAPQLLSSLWGAELSWQPEGSQRSLELLLEGWKDPDLPQQLTLSRCNLVREA